MLSRLASRLLEVPRQAGPIGDVLWRNADTSTVTSAGCGPTGKLSSELEMLLSGEPAQHVAALTPDSQQAAQFAGSLKADWRRGAASNPALPDTDLAMLAADTDASVAAAAKSAQESRAAALAEAKGSGNTTLLFKLGYVEGIQHQLDADPESIVAGMLSAGGTMRMLERLAVTNSRLHHGLLVAWLTSSAPLDAYAVKWALESELRREAFLEGPISDLRRRCSGAAATALMDAGLLTRPAVKAQNFASVEMLAMALPLHEVAGLYVGSDTPVEQGLGDRIMLAAAPTIVANYLLGTCSRRPAPGDTSRLIRQATAEQRSEWAAALTASPDNADALEGLGWAGELLLLGRMDWLEKLSGPAVTSLDRVVCERLGDVPAAWEMTLALAEEWESTLFDLLDASTAMEAETA